MTEKYMLARPYALAAFKQAQEEGKLDMWFEMLHFLEAVTANPNMVKIIKDPHVSKPRLIALLLDIAKGRLSGTGENFVRILINAGRIDVVREILHSFERELDIFKKRIRVEVISAYPLASAYQQDIKTAVARRLGREVWISMAVDKSLIGGAVIRAGDIVIDISVRGRLTQLGLKLS